MELLLAQGAGRPIIPGKPLELGDEGADGGFHGGLNSKKKDLRRASKPETCRPGRPGRPHLWRRVWSRCRERVPDAPANRLLTFIRLISAPRCTGQRKPGNLPPCPPSRTQTHTQGRASSEGRACPDGSTIAPRCVCTAGHLVTASARFNHNAAVSAETASGPERRLSQAPSTKGNKSHLPPPPPAFILDSTLPVCGTGGTISPTRPRASALARILGVRPVRRRW